MYSDNDYYQAAIAEVRERQQPGSATSEQIQMLEDSPDRWEEALTQVIDELESQREVKMQDTEDEIAFAASDSEVEALQDEFRAWRKKNQTFKKYVLRRLREVQRMNGTVRVQESPLDDEDDLLETLKDIAVNAYLNDNAESSHALDEVIDQLVALGKSFHESV